MKHSAFNRHLHGGVVILLCSALFLGLLCGVSGPASAAKPIDPCSLLTKADLSTVLGVEVIAARVEQLKGTDKKYCKYDAGKGSIDVWVHNEPGSHIGFENGKMRQDTKTEPVKGVGDDAYWSPNPKILNILKKGVYVSISGFMVKSWSLEKAKELGVKAIGRLP